MGHDSRGTVAAWLAGALIQNPVPLKIILPTTNGNSNGKKNLKETREGEKSFYLLLKKVGITFDFFSQAMYTKGEKNTMFIVKRKKSPPI